MVVGDPTFMLKTALNWKDYRLIDAGGGEKLEQWDNVLLRRPDPQAIWPKQSPALWDGADAWYHRSTKGGGECGYPMDGLGILFVVGMNVCDVPITDEQSLNYNGFCYHVPMENSSLFNS